MQIFLSFLVLIHLKLAASKTLNVGLLVEDSNKQLSQYFGWEQVAAGVAIAFDTIKERNLLPEYDTLNLTWRKTGCSEHATAGAVIDYARDNLTHVVLGPPCSTAAQTAEVIAGVYNLPMVLWGWIFDSALLDNIKYPTLLASSYPAIYLARSFVRLVKRYNWADIAVLTYINKDSPTSRCKFLVNEIQILFAIDPNLTIVYRANVVNIEVSTFRNVLSPLKTNARVVMVCLESKFARRNLMLAIQEEEMDTEEYVYIMSERRKIGFATAQGSKYWQVDPSLPPDGRDADALGAARRFIIMDETRTQNTSAVFKDNLLKKFKEPPFNCTNCTDLDVFASSVYSLADAMLLFGYLMNRTLERELVASGRNLERNANFVFEGFTGTVTINQNATRIPTFSVWMLDKNDEQQRVLTLTETSNSTISQTMGQMHFLKPESDLFATRSRIPLNMPICGYRGELCPPNFWEQYHDLLFAAAGLLIVLGVIVSLASNYIVRLRHAEEDRLDLLWRVPSTCLIFTKKNNLSTSFASFHSTATASTRTTMESIKRTEFHAFCNFLGDAAIAQKHQMVALTLKEEDRKMLRAMRNVDHDNICKFFGLSMDGPQILSVWKYCSRGSIKNVIKRGGFHMDQFFKYSLIRDISEGIYYLHHSQFGAHGYITSGSCVINERWQVKLTFFGLDAIKASEQKKMEDCLWTAPEHIRDPHLLPTKAGDIYSFAIVSSEILTKKSAWDLENQDYDLEELVYKIRRGSAHSLMRPSLESDDEQNSSMLLLIKDCWSEDPGHRPNCDQIKVLIKSFNDKRSTNLMDHVFNVMEQHASNLEEEVQSRMKELTEEQKKSDMLLYRMLPKQVADKLKTGQSVEPETFDCVTLFFSDVVSFTTIASRCTPFQVVNLLNNLYTTFDEIIDKHDVYKVETIGDGYLCVSGLPHRNGNEHAKEIAEMSKLLIQAIKTIRIAHLPQERINIRVGLHTGSVITGVVGLTMPRYCLFGDAVNTASRIQSNGKAGRIHISTETMRFLTEIIGGYQTESRGEVIVKGTGPVQTYWLLTENDRK